MLLEHCQCDTHSLLPLASAILKTTRARCGFPSERGPKAHLGFLAVALASQLGLGVVRRFVGLVTSLSPWKFPVGFPGSSAGGSRSAGFSPFGQEVLSEAI